MKRLLNVLMAALALCILPVAVHAQSLTSTGAYQPPVCPQGKCAIVETTIPATTSTQIAPANPNRIGIEIQCSAGPTKVSMFGATLTSAAQGTGPAGIILPTAGTLYIPLIPSRMAITAYGPSGFCSVTDYNFQ